MAGKTSEKQSNLIIKERIIEYLPVDDLFFDADNPRFPPSMKNPTEAQVLKWMLSDATIVELMGSIGEQDFFPGEPLLVVPRADKEKTGRKTYTVIEGNRRLSAVKLLKNPELAPSRQRSVQAVAEESEHHPNELPVVIYPERKEVLAYLGFRHISGVKPWGSLEKAVYLRQLMDAHGPVGGDFPKMFRALAKTIGSRAPYVANLLTGLELYQQIVDRDFFRIKNLDDTNIDFSLLTTAIRYENIAHFVGLKDDRDVEVPSLKIDALEELTRWMYERVDRKTRLGESRNIPILNEVVSDKRALAAFRDGRSLDEAEVLSQAPENAFRAAYQSAKSRIEASRDLMHLVNEPTDTDIEVIMEISEVAQNIGLVLKSKKARSIE